MKKTISAIEGLFKKLLDNLKSLKKLFTGLKRDKGATAANSAGSFLEKNKIFDNLGVKEKGSHGAKQSVHDVDLPKNQSARLKQDEIIASGVKGANNKGRAPSPSDAGNSCDISKL